jgi:uncharacterized protein involved in exopolysaccharide biosynthesis
MSLESLKSLDTKRADLESLVEESAEARIVESEFKELGIELPGWFEPAVSSLRREIKTRNQDALAARLRDLKARRESLKTIDEKRNAIDAEIAALEAKTA